MIPTVFEFVLEVTGEDGGVGVAVVAAAVDGDGDEFGLLVELELELEFETAYTGESSEMREYPAIAAVIMTRSCLTLRSGALSNLMNLRTAMLRLTVADKFQLTPSGDVSTV